MAAPRGSRAATTDDVVSSRDSKGGMPDSCKFLGDPGLCGTSGLRISGGAQAFSNPRGTMHNLQIEQTPVHALKPQDRNARTHSKRQVRQIADSMKRFGFNNPILTDDNLQIIAGHGRLEAAKLLGMTAVPSIRLSYERDRKAGLHYCRQRDRLKGRLGSGNPGYRIAGSSRSGIRGGVDRV